MMHTFIIDTPLLRRHLRHAWVDLTALLTL
jgi:hypothetical protein